MFKITNNTVENSIGWKRGANQMANRVFQGVIYQMKDAIGRGVGVVDETGTVISCSDLNMIGEVRDGFVAERLTGDSFVKDGCSYHQFSSNKHNDYAVYVEGADEAAAQFASLLAISLQSIKQYHDEKFDKANFIKNVVLDNILPGDIYAKARELHFATDVSLSLIHIYRRPDAGGVWVPIGQRMGHRLGGEGQRRIAAAFHW